MLSRIHIVLLSAAIILQIKAAAQSSDRTIQWDTTYRTYTTARGAKIVMPYFAGGGGSERNNFVPVYTTNIAMAAPGRVAATLSNEVYETITNPDVKADNIPTSVTVTASTGIFKKRTYAEISLVPLRKNPLTGKVEKLTKFTINLSVTPTPQLRSSLAYASNSALSSGTWYKVAVTGTGVYKLDYDFLKNKCGFDLANTNFSSIAVYGNGGGMVPDLNATARPDDLQENPTYIADNNGNNKVDQGDYILFYGQGPDSWSYDTAQHRFAFTKNLYADSNFYFITPDKGTGKRITTTSAAGAVRTITQFDDYAAHQIDKYNLLNTGKLWLGDRMSTLSPTVTVNFNMPNIVTSAPVRVYSFAAASSAYASTIRVSAGGQTILTHSISGISVSDYPDAYHVDGGDDVFSRPLTGSFTPSSSGFDLTYTFSNPDGNGNSFGYIHNVTINATRALTFTGNYMPFRSLASVGSGPTQFTIAGATSGMHVWDVTDISSIQDIAGSGGSYVANTPTLREFVAVDVNGSFITPIPVATVANQNLHAIGQPNMIIITPDDMLTASGDLAAFHSQRDHLSVKIVTLMQVYNEFGSGKHDISAIRDFVRMVYDKAGSDSTKLPQYLLLMGDGSFDPKDRTADNNNKFPTYESLVSDNILNSYVTDDYFGCLDATEGGDMNDAGQLVDIAIGRLPAADATEAQDMVNKIKLYKSATSLASWRNVVSFVGDEPWGGVYAFEEEANKLGEIVRLNFPAYNVDKIICDAYQRISTPGGFRFPEVNTAILNRINTGTLVISYTGHGGVNNWANARIFNMSDIQNLQNKEKLPLFVTATCDFSRFDDPSKKTAGEYLMTNGQGGAIAMVTTVRPVYQDPNSALQEAMFPFLFTTYHGRRPTVGEAMMETKNIVIHNTPGYTVNTREFVLLGDPAMTLDYPEYNVVTTAVDNVPVAQPHDTLKALKYVTISGEVRDASNNRMTSFNGTCFPLVFDKLTTFKTLQNDPTYPLKIYNTYKNSIFKGQCSVVNGAFSFSFIVPKDINYAIGDGRISYYATNTVTDANGYQNDIVIGGSADTLLSDKDGPKIKLYMNDEKFVYGGITDPNPKLLAELWDTSGINTTGNGLGHDLTAVLDADSKNPVVLNDYYQTALNNFRRGSVSYPFSSLSDGPHTLKVKAWDILNNSAEDNTEFIVEASAKLALKHVYNYPNPFTTHTEFMFEHNRPGQELKIQVQIYSVSGHIVKTIQEDVVASGYRVDDLHWDGLDDYGDKIGKGVYIYKIHVKDQQGNTADQFQKLVVLR
ncbi:MAG: type IX secretion system sortase PorU [Bacteroidetes bacterium]|nr:type IX secretion system sortase PorU [Bacteroidota bacterium]